MRHLPTPKGLRAQKGPRCPLCNRRRRRKAKRCAFCSFTVAAQEAQKAQAAELAAARQAKRAAKTKAHLEAIVWLVQDGTDRYDLLHDEAQEEDIKRDIVVEATTAPEQDKEAASPA